MKNVQPNLIFKEQKFRLFILGRRKPRCESTKQSNKETNLTKLKRTKASPFYPWKAKTKLEVTFFYQ
jgi:hypothetical protein